MSFRLRDVIAGGGLGTKKTTGRLMEGDAHLVEMLDPETLKGGLSRPVQGANVVLAKMLFGIVIG